MKVEDLERLYLDGVEIDREVFAEQRSNILLVSGNHYSKHRTRLWETLRDTRDINTKQKLRLQRNHTHKICRIYEENILTFTPGVTVLPKNEGERQDQKAAELYQSVMADVKERINFKEKKIQLCANYVRVGEVAAKCFWDPSKGSFLGYEQKIDPLSEEPLFDEMGQPVPDEERPRFSGDLVVEEIYGFNLFRPSGAESLQECEWLGIRKMVDKDELKAAYGKDDERLKKVEEASKEEFVIFDSTRSEFTKSKNQILWKEIYYRPSPKYPNGYFYMYTSTGIFEEGEIPFGIFPIVLREMEKYPTAPRGQSVPIKIFRPYQGEANRATSSQAMAQITLGDDKVLIQAGTKLAPGGQLPGVRALTFQGQIAPTILPGRDGSQYAQYADSMIMDGYRACMIEEENQEKDSQVGDTLALLYRAIRQKKKFAKYAEGFELFLIDLMELCLKIMKEYLPEDEVIQAIGRSEAINISEFKNADPMRVQVVLEPGDETLENKMGKHIVLTNILQYVGKQLKPEDIGRIIRSMPFVNKEKAFGDLTIDSENAENLMLALERGQVPPANPYDNHAYLIKRLVKRMREASFQFLAPEIQQAYELKIKEHEALETENQRKILAAQAQFIPADGPLVKADVYIGDPNNPEKQPKRAQIPQRALEWLIQRLEDQGNSLEKLEGMNAKAMADMAQMILGGGEVPPESGEARPMLMPPSQTQPMAPASAY